MDNFKYIIDVHRYTYNSIKTYFLIYSVQNWEYIDICWVNICLGVNYTMSMFNNNKEINKINTIYQKNC
jgi:hypothetical protein